MTRFVQWLRAGMFSLHQRLSFRPNPIHLWNEDVEFQKLMEKLQGHTLVDRRRCFMLYQYARHVRALEGDVAEIGVYKGGTARLLAEGLQQSGKRLHLFDTFVGMPVTSKEKDPYHREGDFDDVSLEGVKNYLRSYTEVQFYVGRFPSTAASLQDTKFCLVHVDVDIYQSVLDCCIFFYPRLAPGGLMIFDDYGFLSCSGARIAVDEYFKAKPESPIYLPTGQSLVIRV